MPHVLATIALFAGAGYLLFRAYQQYEADEEADERSWLKYAEYGGSGLVCFFLGLLNLTQ